MHLKSTEKRLKKRMRVQSTTQNKLDQVSIKLFVE